MAQTIRITAIKRQAKRADYVSIFLDGSFAFSLHESQLVASGLSVGKELASQEVKQWEGESDFAKAYDKTLNFVTIRPRSRQEISDYFRRRQVDETLRSRIFKRLEERGYIGDEKFAAFWVRSRALAKPTSRRKLELELRHKGVENEIIQKTLQENSDYNEQTALREIINKKQKKYPDQNKFIAYLARQGFAYADIKQALSAEN